MVLSMHRLFPDAPLYTLVHDPRKIKNFFGDLNIRTSFIQKLPFSHRRLRWYLSLMPTAIESFDLSDYDVILSSASAFGKGAIAPPRAVHICYCHTPTRYLWSDANTYLSEMGVSGITKGVLDIILNRIRMWDQLAAQRVDYFIANSRFIQERIRRYYNRQSTVMYPPVDVQNYPQLPERKPYYVLLSRLRPYKRVDLAIKAFNRLGMRLVIAGDGEERSKLAKLAGPTITFAGDVTEQEKKKLFAGAQGFINPQEEDFGITAVEAMAAGTPVIAFGAGGTLETVIEGSTGLFFEEQTWQCLADAVIRAQRHRFDHELIRRHAQTFSTARFEQELKAFVETAHLARLEGAESARARVV